MKTKKCSKCKKRRRVSRFNKHGGNKDGLQNHCTPCRRQYNYENREKIRKKCKEYYNQTAPERRKKSSEWYYANKQRVFKRYVQRRKEDPVFKLKCYVRSSVSKILRQNKVRKRERTMELLGCTFRDLKEHLESKFLDGMNWDNYGEWHLDHVKPLSSFNLKNSKELKQAWNYKNLQPLWAKDNLKKHAKLDWCSEN